MQKFDRRSGRSRNANFAAGRDVRGVSGVVSRQLRAVRSARSARIFRRDSARCGVQSPLHAQLRVTRLVPPYFTEALPFSRPAEAPRRA